MNKYIIEQLNKDIKDHVEDAIIEVLEELKEYVIEHAFDDLPQDGNVISAERLVKDAFNKTIDDLKYN